MHEYEIIYDYSDEYSDTYNIREMFFGSWEDLQAYIKRMKETGCYNIDATEVGTY